MLLLSLVVNLGLLCTFKYLGFLLSSFGELIGFMRLEINIPHLELLLPVGISFYTFQTIGYTIDVYRNKSSVERHFGYFALYVSYFPQLVAGPIERASRLLPSLRQKHNFSWERTVSGLRQMLWGFFKKVVVADNLAAAIDPIFADPSSQGSATLFMAACCFVVQVYGDFSGYSDIAIGGARILGHDLMTNFKRPLFATDISDFWRRWHISLGTWFRDYLYFPLGGNRKGPWASFRNFMIVCLLIGLWHGASWTFVIWGGLMGAWMGVRVILRPVREGIGAPWFPKQPSKFRTVLRIVFTFSLFCFISVWFRCPDLGQTFLYYQGIFDWSVAATLSGFLDKNVVALTAVVILLTIEGVIKDRSFEEVLSKHSFYRGLLDAVILSLILIIGKYDAQQFFYFQF
jgi:D-alanyl-lipoteichoic acid acyltransferase DltB (MBOAT superfamily)